MAKELTEKEIKAFGANVVKEYLIKEGYKTISIIPRTDYLLMRVEKGNESNLVAINTVTYPSNGDDIDIKDIHDLMKFATENKLKLFYAGVGLIDMDSFSGVITENSNIMVNFKGLKEITQ